MDARNLKLLIVLFQNTEQKTKSLIENLIKNTQNLLNDVKFINDLEKQLTIDHFLSTKKKIIDKNKIIPDLVGFHGQTIFHDPKIATSIQIGDAELLKKLIKVDIT